MDDNGITSRGFGHFLGNEVSVLAYKGRMSVRNPPIGDVSPDSIKLGPFGPLMITRGLWPRGERMKMEMKLASLDSYRASMDESEKELFDILMGYARELLTTVEQRELAIAAGN